MSAGEGTTNYKPGPPPPRPTPPLAPSGAYGLWQMPVVSAPPLTLETLVQAGVQAGFLTVNEARERVGFPPERKQGRHPKMTTL